MVERSLPWDGTSIGHAIGIAPYDAATEFASILRYVSGSEVKTNKSGVFFATSASLQVTSVGTSPVAVAAGAAIVYGTIYENTASFNVAIPTPAGSTRIDRIVLRKTWAAQTVVITRIAGTEGAGAPTLHQTAGVDWDEPLAQVSITTGGVITITDQRENAEPASNNTPTKIKFDAAGGAGADNAWSRSDHTHEIDDPGVASTQAFGDAAIEGTSLNPSRADHKHAMPVVYRKYKTLDTNGGAGVDADLQFPVNNGDIFLFEGVILYVDSASATDLRFSLSVPGGSTYQISLMGPTFGTPDTIKSIVIPGADPGPYNFGLDTTVRSLHFRGTITCAAGTFGLILNSSSGTPSIKKYSHLLGFKT